MKTLPEWVMGKQSATITGVWLRNPSGRCPEVFLEIDGKWHLVLTDSDIRNHVSLIREVYPENWPIYDPL